MVLATAFQSLHQRMHRLDEVTRDLTIALREDQPTERAPAAECWADNAENFHGFVSESLEESGNACGALGPAPDLYNLRRHLFTCHQSFNAAMKVWLVELVTFEQVEELTALAQKPKREWQAWIKGVNIALACCHEPVEKSAEALLVCWQELSERNGGMSVMVNSTGVGQHVNGGMEKEAAGPE